MEKKELLKRLNQIQKELDDEYFNDSDKIKELKLGFLIIGEHVGKLIDEIEDEIYEETITESNDLYEGDTKIFDTAELNLMADKIINRFGDIKEFEKFYPKAFEYADGYISESALADEYGVDEEDIEENYYDYIDAFVDSI